MNEQTTTQQEQQQYNAEDDADNLFQYGHNLDWKAWAEKESVE